MMTIALIVVSLYASFAGLAFFMEMSAGLPAPTVKQKFLMILLGGPLVWMIYLLVVVCDVAVRLAEFTTKKIK